MVNGKAIDDAVINMNADDPDLRVFQSTGGKILSYHGLADHYSPPHHSAAYYEGSANFTGGMNETSQFHRLFLVPGMEHCIPESGQAGLANIPFPKPDQWIEKLVNWVENDEAPEEVMAETEDRLISRPICPYPNMPKYDGTGDVNNATSFRC